MAGLNYGFLREGASRVLRIGSPDERKHGLASMLLKHEGLRWICGGPLLITISAYRGGLPAAAEARRTAVPGSPASPMLQRLRGASGAPVPALRSRPPNGPLQPLQDKLRAVGWTSLLRAWCPPERLSNSRWLAQSSFPSSTGPLSGPGHFRPLNSVSPAPQPAQPTFVTHAPRTLGPAPPVLTAPAPPISRPPCRLFIGLRE
jgi:hypothetical protein